MFIPIPTLQQFISAQLMAVTFMLICISVSLFFIARNAHINHLNLKIELDSIKRGMVAGFTGVSDTLSKDQNVGLRYNMANNRYTSTSSREVRAPESSNDDWANIPNSPTPLADWPRVYGQDNSTYDDGVVPSYAETLRDLSGAAGSDLSGGSAFSGEAGAGEVFPTPLKPLEIRLGPNSWPAQP